MKFFFTSSLIISLLFLSACADFLTKQYTKKLTTISADIAMHGIEIECFKIENGRWPLSFSEMETYQAKALPCVGLSVDANQLWQQYPTAKIKSVDEHTALIIISEKINRNGKLIPLTQPMRIHYTINYQRSTYQVEKHFCHEK